MKSSSRLAAVVIVLLIICSSMSNCGSPEETGNSEDQRKRQSAGGTEADEEGEFAAAVLDLVHVRVRDVGNVFRVMGNTAGGLAGGSIKAVGAGVHGVSSMLDAISRTVEPKPGALVEGTSPSSASSDDLSEAVDRAETRESRPHTAHDRGQDASHSSKSSSSSPDPFDRISSMARSFLAGSLKLVSAATRGVGDAVFQARTAVEELTGGTGQVAAPGAMRVVVMAWKLCRDTGAVALVMLEEALPKVVGLFRGKNGALLSALRLAILIMLVLAVCRGRRRHRRNGLSQQQQQLNLQSAETAPPTTPQRSHAVVGKAPPSEPAAAASSGLASPSRSFFPRTPISFAQPSPPVAVGHLSSFGTYDGAPDGLDPLLPSPTEALARAPHARAGRMRAAGWGEMATGLVDEDIDVEGAATTTSGRVASEEEATRGRWDWRRVFRWAGQRRPRGEGIVRWRWILLVLLWISASVLEEIERDRVAWLAWDEGFRAGEACRAGDPDAAAESVAWLNGLIDGMWGGQRSGLHPRKSDIGVARGTAASPGVLDGLRSFVSEHLGTSIAEALDELNSKPGRVVRVELQEIDLGSSSPQILGVKVLDPASPAVPGWGDDRCGTLEKDCLALRVDLEVATRGLRVGVGVKPSVRSGKTLLPTGKVRLLELCFRGSLSIRVERRDEFPFVGMALVAFDGVPDVQVRMEQWGLDTLTLGRLDKWVGKGVQVALKSFVLPMYLEVDAARALCSECPASTPTSASLRQESLDGVVGAGPNTRSGRPSSRPLVAAAAAASAALDQPLEPRARSQRTSSSGKPLVGDTAADELRRQARIASDRDPKESGGSLGRDSSSGENVAHTSFSMVSEASAAAADPKIRKQGLGIGRVLRRFKDWLMSGLDEEMYAEADGTWRLSPMDLDGFE